MNRLISNRCNVCDWHSEGYRGECPQCLADENKLLRETVAKWEKERAHCRQQAENWEHRADKLQGQVKALVEALKTGIAHLEDVSWNRRVAARLIMRDALALVERKP